MNTNPEHSYPRLGPKQQKGSKPRCHLMTSGLPGEVANRLTNLIRIDGITVREEDCWLPQGFDVIHEAQLGTEGKSVITDEGIRKSLRDWWLSVPSDRANTPNWDIASTCTINGKKGLLLVEGKAHDSELRNEERGKPLEREDGNGVSMNSQLNHNQIGEAIERASRILGSATGLQWALSRDRNYQMSNRFAWSCKLAELGFPVVLIYLGFLRADEMKRGKQTSFSTHEEWENAVLAHSSMLFPQSVWGQPIDAAEACILPLIRSIDQPLTLIATP
jgi:hypothetical protein